MNNKALDCVIKSENGITVAGVTGRIDGLSAHDFEGRLLELIAGGVKYLVLNFETVEYISSAGLRCLLVVAKMLKNKKGLFAVCNLNTTVKEIFEMVNFDEIARVFKSEKEAVDEYSKFLEKPMNDWWVK